MATENEAEAREARRQRIRRRVTAAAVVLLRVIVGATFVFSGYAKGIDPWGTVYKINEYLIHWDLDIPGALVTFATFTLSAWEFVWGSLLVLGCYRRVSVICLLLTMVVMLPLTLYIVIFNPVADCGCFGELLVISNTATFVKNIIITAALVYLLIRNVGVVAVYTKHTQWIIGGLLTFYIVALSLYGYNVQPLQDFRRFAPGTDLLSVGADDDSADETAPQYIFIYERDGESREFDEDALPDSTWTYVDRRLVAGSESADDGFAVMVDGEDILPDIIDPETEQFIVTIPDVGRVDISYTNLINDLNDYIEERGGSLVAFIAGDEDMIDYWDDISMATYKIYQVEPNLVKELARGTSALVYLDHGVIKWKRTLSSVDFESAARHSRGNLVVTLDPRPGHVLFMITSVLLGMMLLIWIVDRFLPGEKPGKDKKEAKKEKEKAPETT